MFLRLLDCRDRLLQPRRRPILPSGQQMTRDRTIACGRSARWEQSGSSNGPQSRRCASARSRPARVMICYDSPSNKGDCASTPGREGIAARPCGVRLRPGGTRCFPPGRAGTRAPRAPRGKHAFSGCRRYGTIDRYVSAFQPPPTSPQHLARRLEPEPGSPGFRWPSTRGHGADAGSGQGCRRAHRSGDADGAEFAILTGGRRVLSRTRLGGLVRAVSTRAVKAFCRATERWTVLRDQIVTLSLDEHAIARFTRKFRIAKGADGAPPSKVGADP